MLFKVGDCEAMTMLGCSVLKLEIIKQNYFHATDQSDIHNVATPVVIHGQEIFPNHRLTGREIVKKRSVIGLLFAFMAESSPFFCLQRKVLRVHEAPTTGRARSCILYSCFATWQTVKLCLFFKSILAARTYWRQVQAPEFHMKSGKSLRFVMVHARSSRNRKCSSRSSVRK